VKGGDWTFDGTWPYEPRWFESTDGRMHYVDEGPRDGRPVVLIHGNPTWGYLYREFIPPLVAAGARAIVPDHLGFGRADKPRGRGLYRVARHALRLEALLESLDVRGAVIVPHDWGGPIGLFWATRHHDRIAGMFIINTLAHGFRREMLPPGKNRLPLPVPLHLFRTPGIGELLVQGLDAFKPLLFTLGIEHKERLTPHVRRAYRNVHAGWSDRAAMLAFTRELPVREGGPVDDMNREIEALLRQHFRSTPVRIVWGVKDRVLPPSFVDILWLDTFPDAEVTRIHDSGHFVQEDAPDRVIPELTRFVS
jgi:pimeloyl-ACP methyl ester carboxylesterase